MPAERSTKMQLEAGSSFTQASGQSSKKVQVPTPCTICGVIISRSSDVNRHMKRHDQSAEKLPCPFEWRGCKYKTLQQSNLDTHIRRHLNIKSCVCTDSNDCDYRTHDPALLLKHRKRRHGYIPNRRRKPAKLSSNFIIPEVPSFHDSYPPPMSDMDLFVHFLADMEQLDALEFGFNQ